jgi:hypothetical protein
MDRNRTAVPQRTVLAVVVRAAVAQLAVAVTVTCWESDVAQAVVRVAVTRAWMVHPRVRVVWVLAAVDQPVERDAIRDTRTA